MSEKTADNKVQFESKKHRMAHVKCFHFVEVIGKRGWSLCTSWISLMCFSAMKRTSRQRIFDRSSVSCGGNKISLSSRTSSYVNVPRRSRRTPAFVQQLKSSQGNIAIKKRCWTWGKELCKTKTTTVEEYTDPFAHLMTLEGPRMGLAEQCCLFSTGIPKSW
jgi:hypothetical protein